MATKTKSKNKPAKAKKATKKVAPKRAALKKSPAKKLAKKAPKKAPRKAKRKTAAKGGARRKAEVTLAVSSDARRLGVEQGAGDLQGLSGIASADSESVDELLDEGNAFEAEVIKGVEDAGDNDEEEVHTHELPEDDVPEEYLDNE
jgi:hypothetical protein